MNESGAFRARVKSAVRATLLLSVAAVAVAQQGARAPLTVTGITPSGTNVPASRQIVLQFYRPVVPIGRMDRTAAEIPIAITPPVACQWRWLDTSALACQLADGDELTLATRYTLVINEGIAAEDGATTSGAVRHEFTTERPRVSYPSFATWRSPGMPVIRAVFTQAVGESSLREHLFMRHAGAARVPVEIEADTELRELPQYIRLPGERVFIDFGERQTAPVDDRPTTVAGEVARRVWLVRPRAELPLDARVALVVEPGLESGDGPERGDENRVAVEFYTFPEFAFLGVRCSRIDGDELAIGNASPTQGECNPLAGVGLEFSAPVLASEIKSHVEILPGLAGGRTDYDPWANWRDYSQLMQPHERGATYTVWLPERLRAATAYRLRTPEPSAGPRDEFGRTLAAPLDLAFTTSHRPPDYTLVHPTSVLEHGVDSEVPLYVTNLAGYRVDYRTLTAAGEADGRVLTRALPAVEDLQYAVPLGVREMLGGEPGVLYGRLSTDPELAKEQWQDGLFAAVTPYQLHVKLGHFNTLVWATELATGAPLRGAAVALYVDELSSPSAGVPPLAAGTTDADGVVLLPGQRELDATLALSGYGCAERAADDCPRLFVRVDGPAGLAVLPLDYRFEVDTYRASGYTVFSEPQPRYGHLHAWGTTAQGVYRAGDTLDYKLYVRDQSNESLVAAPPGPYVLEIVDPTGQVVHTVPQVMLSEFGSFAGAYPIPRSAAVGWYEFRLTAPLPPGAAAPEQDDGTIVRLPLRVLVSDFTPSPFGVRTAVNGAHFAAGAPVPSTTR